MILAMGCSRGPIGFKFGSDESDSSRESSDGKVDVSGVIVGFDEVNAKVFSKYCQTCHGGQEAPLMNSYQTYKNEIRDILQTVVVERSMPKKKVLSEEQVVLVKKWIEQGAKEFSSGGVTTTTLPETEIQIMTFEKINQEFYEAKCTSCHFANNPEKRNDYSTYDKFRDNIGTIIASTHIYITMPPGLTEEQIGEGNPNQLTRAEKEMINKWILDGQVEK